jgi:hypothetical protein
VNTEIAVLASKVSMSSYFDMQSDAKCSGGTCTYAIM